MKPHNLTISRGRPMPLGVTYHPEGHNFVLMCRHGTKVVLVILPETENEPLAEIELNARWHRTGDMWHVQVGGLPSTFRYGWRVDGPRTPRTRFDPSRLLLDPAATMLSDGAVWAGTCEVDPQRTSRRSLVHYSRRYHWDDDAPPLTPLEDTIIYELHVRGFTCHPSSGVQHPGTFRGLIEKIDYLKWLGITAVELMPIFEFDECNCPFVNPQTGERLVDYWGYNPIAFAAPKAAYAASARQHGQNREFRDLVKALHAAGIEVILDVVFNHTGEGDDRGRTYSFRGLDNELYYLLDDEGRYLNYSGCGNTVNCNHPVVRDLIMTCLRYWVGEMHVDGFRFDLASILGRDRQGRLMVEPPVIESIAEDAILADTKLIAEPWDAAGVYQVGTFPYGRRWSEWNGRYRDEVRRFWRGEPGWAGSVASRICGSADIYQSSGRLPRHSINFITCHDGFTLHDLVSYNQKHNWANGENNRDGTDLNYSWNCGVEGETEDPAVLALRRRQVRNLIATLLISQGVPMLLAGDEFLRTQKGNNNAWCQDNDISWVNWELAEQNKDFLRFVREMIWLRKRHPVLRRRRFFVGPLHGVELRHHPIGPFPSTGPVRPEEAGLSGLRAHPGHLPPAPPDVYPGLADIHWHGVEPYQPDFSPTSRSLAFALDGRFTGREYDADYRIDADFYVAMNAWEQPLHFRIPPSPTRRPWHRVVDTALSSPDDFIPEEQGPVIEPGSRYTLIPFSMIILVSRL